MATEPFEAVIVIIPCRDVDAAFAVCMVTSKVPEEVVPEVGVIPIHASPFAAVHVSTSLVVGLVTVTVKVVPAVAGETNISGDTAIDGPASWFTVMITVLLTPVVVGVRVTVPVLAASVLAAMTRVILTVVVASVSDGTIQLSLEVMINEIASEVVLLYTLMEAVPPVKSELTVVISAASVASEGTWSANWFTVIVTVDVSLSVADIKMLPVLARPVVFSATVTVKLPGVLPEEGDTEIHVSLGTTEYAIVASPVALTTLTTWVVPATGTVRVVTSAARAFPDSKTPTKSRPSVSLTIGLVDVKE